MTNRVNIDTPAEILNFYEKSVNSQSSLIHKAGDFRIIVERVVKYYLEIPIGEHHPLAKLISLLATKHPMTFRAGLKRKAEELAAFSNKWHHSSSDVLTLEEFIKFKLILEEFCTTVLEVSFKPKESVSIPQLGEVVSGKGKKLKAIKGFKIDKSWIGEGLTIQSTFTSGSHSGMVVEYDHDAVYESAKAHLNSLPSFHRDRFNYCRTNVPGYAKHLVKYIK